MISISRLVAVGAFAALVSLSSPIAISQAAQESVDEQQEFSSLLPKAEKGDASAQFLVGNSYHFALGVPRNYADALKWYRASANNNDRRAQFFLAQQMYRKGEGVPTNTDEAVRWYRLAADQGYTGAMLSLAYIYANGEGVPKNDAEAVKWFRLAADQGDAYAQSNLGYMYGNGEGVPESKVDAYFWWNLAAAQGEASAKNNKAIIEKTMTREQIAEAQQRSAAWKPKK